MSKPQLYENNRRHIYRADENRNLSVVIAETVAEHEGRDLMEDPFRLSDPINSTALNRLFCFDQRGSATVSFAVSESYVFLRDVGNGVEIWVSDLPHG